MISSGSDLAAEFNMCPPLRSIIAAISNGGCRVRLIRVCGLLLLMANVGFAQNSLFQPLAALQKELRGKLERITVHAKSLEGNLEGDSADRDVFVYLPPSYEKESGRRY